MPCMSDNHRQSIKGCLPFDNSAQHSNSNNYFHQTIIYKHFTQTHQPKTIKMVRRSTRTTTTRKPMFSMHMGRRRAHPTTTHTTHHSHHTHATPVHAPVRRRASIGDKISGAMMKLRGSLTRRPGLKAAGTRRMHGTDGRGSHRVY